MSNFDAEEDMEFNSKYDEKHDADNVKGIIDKLKSTPISHTNFEGVYEKRDSQISVVRSHINEKYDKIKEQREKLDAYKKSDKDFADWFDNHLPSTPGYKHHFQIYVQQRDVIELLHLIIRLYESIDIGAKNALKDSKAIDLQRHLTTELNKMIEQNNNFIKELMTTNNGQIQDNTKNTVEIFGSKMNMLLEKFQMLTKMQEERQQHFEEKIVNSLVSRTILTQRDSREILTDFGTKSKVTFEKPDISKLKKEVVEKLSDEEIEELKDNKSVVPLTGAPINQSEIFKCKLCNWEFNDATKFKMHNDMLHPKEKK
jgi:hypothetical protein